MTHPEGLRLDRVRETPVARLSGEIDLSNAAIIKRSIAENVSNQDLSLVLDLSGVTYLDSAGIAMLFDLSRRLIQHQQELILVVPAGQFQPPAVVVPAPAPTVREGLVHSVRLALLLRSAQRRRAMVATSAGPEV